eukprot:6993309-Pyramimonas_sp.AAC.1
MCDVGPRSRRKTTGDTTGTLLYDGRYPSLRLIRRETAYVQQQDALHGKTSVREVLMFTAMMKLRVPNEVNSPSRPRMNSPPPCMNSPPPRLNSPHKLTLVYPGAAAAGGELLVVTQVRRQRVDEVITQLGLQACRDTLIGNRFMKGVSGGEAKRVSVGCSLMQRPRCMFMDEPTTGGLVHLCHAELRY